MNGMDQQFRSGNGSATSQLAHQTAKFGHSVERRKTGASNAGFVEQDRT